MSDKNKNKNVFVLLIVGIAAYFLFKPKNTKNSSSSTNNTSAPPVKYVFDKANRLLFDSNNYVVADGVMSFDSSSLLVTYVNGWTLDLSIGILKNDKGMVLTQNVNPNGLKVDKTLLFPVPKKIYGYLNSYSTFLYIENDKTPYYLIDSYFYNHAALIGVNSITSEFYTNIKGYMPVNADTSNITGYNTSDIMYAAAVLFYMQSQFDKLGNLMMYKRGNFEFNFNWQGVLYIKDNNYQQIVGAGVTALDLKNGYVYFDDKYFLNLKTNTLFDSSGMLISSTIYNYASKSSWSTGVGSYADANGDLQNLSIDQRQNGLIPNKPTGVVYKIY